jgi:hypothetical protein
MAGQTGVVIVELRAVPECPNLAATRDLLRACVAEAGLPLSVIVERVGDYPSPSVLVDGLDVTGADPYGPAACVLAQPTAVQIRAALTGTPGAEPGERGRRGESGVLLTIGRSDPG